MDLLVFSVIILILLSATFFTLLRKSLRKEDKYIQVVEELEKSNDSLYDFISKMSETLSVGKAYLHNLDEKGYFRSDDEIGYYFDQLKTLQEDLDKFIITNIKNDEEKEIRES